MAWHIYKPAILNKQGAVPFNWQAYFQLAIFIPEMA